MVAPPDFLAHFEKFLVYSFLCLVSYIAIFSESSAIFLEAPDSGLNNGQKIVVLTRLKLVLFKFLFHFFSFIPLFLTVDQFLGVTPNQ